MEQVHRTILQKNRTLIIQNMANPDVVNDLLFEKNLFTESMRQEVEAESTKNAQVRKILDYVPKRGPTAFNTFYETLIESSNETIADILRPELRGSHPHVGGGERGYAIPQEDMDLPSDWPNELAMTAPVQVTPCYVRSELVRTMWNNPNVYSMKKKNRGVCLIISNKIFYGPRDEKGQCILSTRIGTEKDVADLEKLFALLHFDITIKQDLTKSEMVEELFRESTNSAHAAAECFVCVICSHGTREGIYGTDGDVLPLEQLTTYFDSAHCPNLGEKPKLFFIQACQGEDTDRPNMNNQTAETNAGQDLSNLLKELNVDQRDGDQFDAARVTVAQSTPSKADMIVACATHPGYVSLRNQQFGSWFLQAVVYVFQKYACKESIQDLLTLVNRLVAKGRTALGGNGPRDVMQAAMFKSSLTKKFMFFPGVIADNEMAGQ